MNQNILVHQYRVAQLHAEAEQERQAREAVKASEAHTLAERVADRALRWVKAA